MTAFTARIGRGGRYRTYDYLRRSATAQGRADATDRANAFLRRSGHPCLVRAGVLEGARNKKVSILAQYDLVLK